MPESAHISVIRSAPDAWRIVLSGDWTASRRPDISPALAELNQAQDVRRLSFEAAALGRWDSFLLMVLQQFHTVCAARKIAFDVGSLPEGVRGLLNLAWAVPERAGARRETRREPFLERLGKQTLSRFEACSAAVTFAGDLVIGLARAAAGRARYRRSDIALFMQECGGSALPIVSLISFLVGTILAFVGSIQLKMFGAEIYIADLVGLGMAIEMGALMTAIIMAGRTGASYAAQLGTMQVNEEIDALQTLGIPAVEFLVLPRVIALFCMMPLLCLYSDLMGMLGGALVGIGLMGLEPAQFYHELAGAVGLNHFAQGLIKAAAFGVVIAFCGCLQGLRCGRSAQAVGEATTRAVVQCIVWIVVTDAILTFIYMQTGF